MAEWTKEYQQMILEKSFKENLNYWERTLKVDSDLSKEAYIHAIDEIPHTNPYKYIDAERFDEDVREAFIKSRKMDCWGKDWERH